MQIYKKYFTDRSFLISFLSGLLLLAISLVMQFIASNYATRASSNHVTDIILSNIGPYNVDGIFVWGAVILLIVGTTIGLRNINYLPFMMKSIAFFVVTRSIFVSLTHISPFPTQILIKSEFFKDAMFNGIFNGNDLFFSGHTGLPFLLALLFWDNVKLRFTFLSFSILFAIVVLLGHLHYSIDVLAAYFITYTIFQICRALFKKDWELFSAK